MSQYRSSPTTARAEATSVSPGLPTSIKEELPTKALIKSVDMSEQNQQEAVEVAMTALEKFNVEKDMAMYIKREFDRRHGTCWHCVVGKNFGSFVTHETKNFIYFYLGPIAVLLWKTS